jgi:hypothetical protein
MFFGFRESVNPSLYIRLCRRYSKIVLDSERRLRTLVLEGSVGNRQEWRSGDGLAPAKGRRKPGNLSGRSDTAISGAGGDLGDTLDKRRCGHGATSSRKRWINQLGPGQP